MQAKTLGQLAQHVGGKIDGDADILIKGASTLEKACKSDIGFLANAKYFPQLKTTKAGAVIVSKKTETPASQLIIDDPYYAFRQIVVLMYGQRQHKKTSISDKASIAKNAKLGDNCNIYDFVTICDDVKVGSRCVMYPGVFVGPDTEIGDDCILYPNVVIYDNCKIGSRVTIQANATIGEDGFGFATHNGEHHKIPHIGTTIIEDDVDIGSGCAIERGTIDETVIGRGTKLGDLVGIGHGTKVGPYCLLVVQVGIAGSTTLGHHCIVGGQVGITGHIKVGDGVMIGAMSGVANNVPAGKIILGTPAIDANKTKRIYATMQNLPQMRKDIRKIKKKLEKTDSLEKS